MGKNGIYRNGHNECVYDMNHVRNRMELYFHQFDVSQSMIALKIKHTKRVVNEILLLGKQLHMKQDELALCEVIALLHDYARFPQALLYGTFMDQISFDHGTMASKLLFDKGKIREFIQDSRFDDIIYAAIYYHNKAEVNKDLDQYTRRFVDLLRDSDKLDIFYVRLLQKHIFEKEADCELVVSDYAMDCFRKHHYMLHQHRKTKLDIYLSTLAFVFDVNLIETLKEIKKRNLVNQMLAIHVSIETRKQLDEIQFLVDEYIDNRIKE